MLSQLKKPWRIALLRHLERQTRIAGLGKMLQEPECVTLVRAKELLEAAEQGKLKERLTAAERQLERAVREGMPAGGQDKEQGESAPAS